MSKDNGKQRALLPEILLNLNYGLLFCGAVMAPALAINSGSAKAARSCLILMPVALIFLLLRKKCNHFLTFIISHVLFAAAVIFAGTRLLNSNLLLGALIVFMILTALFSFMQRLSHEKSILGLATLLTIAGIFLLESFVVNYHYGIRLDNLYAGFIAAAVVFFMLYTQVFYVNKAVAANRQSSCQLNSLIRYNNRIFALFLMIVAAVMLTFFQLSGLLSIILNVIGNALKWLLRKLLSGQAPEIEEVIDEQVSLAPQEDLSAFFGDYEAKEPLIPEEVIVALASVLLVVCLAAGLCYLAYCLYRRFVIRHESGGDLREFIDEPLIEHSKKSRRGLSVLLERIVGPQNKDRRLFYRRVIEYHKKNQLKIARSETADEIALRMAENDSEILRAL